MNDAARSERATNDDERRRADEVSLCHGCARNPKRFFVLVVLQKRRDYFLESQTAVPPESSTKRSRRLRLNATERHHVAVCFALHARPRRGRALLWVREATHRPPAPSRSARVSTPTASTRRFAARCVSLPEPVDRASDGRADPFPARLSLSGSLRDSKRGEDGDVDVLALSRAR